MCCRQSRGQTTSDISDGKRNVHFGVFQIMGCHCFIRRLCFFIQQHTIVRCNLPYGQWCSSSRVLHLLFLITMDSTPNCSFPAVLRCLLSFCPRLFQCCKNHRDGWRTELKKKTRKLVSTTENQSQRKDSFGKWVCVSWEDENENKNQRCCCFAELALWSLVVCVLKGDLSYQLTEMTWTQTSHSTQTHTPSRRESRILEEERDDWRSGSDGWQGRKRKREKIF